MDCPRCKTELKPAKLSEAAITYSASSCPACKGSWVSSEQLSQIEMDEKAALIEFRSIPGSAEQRTPLACPECAKTMEKVVSERDAKVVVDVCRPCGKAWLDAGEIDAIRTDSLVASVTQLFRWMKSHQSPRR
jgi:Zn-finger nucleic acid-binding protein